MLGGIGKVFKAVGGVMKSIGKLANVMKNFMQSPFGSLLGMIFPGAGGAMGMFSMFGMFNGLSGGIGGGRNY